MYSDRITTLSNVRQAERAARQAEREARDLIYKNEMWDEKHRDYNDASASWELHPRLSDPANDTWERTFVVSTRADLTPSQARTYAAELLLLADAAADQTAAAELLVQRA